MSVEIRRIPTPINPTEIITDTESRRIAIQFLLECFENPGLENEIRKKYFPIVVTYPKAPVAYQSVGHTITNIDTEIFGQGNRRPFQDLVNAVGQASNLESNLL